MLQILLLALFYKDKIRYIVLTNDDRSHHFHVLHVQGPMIHVRCTFTVRGFS